MPLTLACISIFLPLCFGWHLINEHEFITKAAADQAAADAVAAERAAFLADAPKQIKRREKMLRQIADLEAAHASGAPLDADQRDKVRFCAGFYTLLAFRLLFFSCCFCSPVYVFMD